MSNEKLQQLVLENFSSSGASVPVFSVPVTTRLDQVVVQEYAVLAGHLGFDSRSALMRAVLESAVPDLVELATEVARSNGDHLNQLLFDLEDAR